jgi:tetratricopeptide (TPR) repeat protein
MYKGLGMAVKNRWIASILWAAAVSSGLSGCGVALNPGSITMFKDTTPSQQAMDALARNDVVKAEAYGNQALKDNPNDPYALLALAIVYQHTGRPEGARQYYELVVSMHSEDLVPSTSGGEPQTVDEIARHNLAVMTGSMTPVVSTSEVMAEKSFVEDGNVILRFQGLRRLLDQDLITREEYDLRRSNNLGALLQYTAAKAPAFGITRPAPESNQIIERLHAIAANYQEQSISAEEQSMERDIILEALMPAKPDRRADRPAPVSDELQYAAKVGRLQRLLESGVVTKAEADRERKAIDSQLTQARAAKIEADRAAEQAALAAEAVANGAPPPPPPPVVVPTGDEAVLLGSYGSKKGAEKAWSTIQGQFQAELGPLTHHVAKVTINKRRGIASYRLSAGPLADEEAAKKVCRALKLYDLSCTPIKMTEK